MNILLISPLGFAIHESTRYAGIEKLVHSYARELCKKHNVSVMAHADSNFPHSVAFMPTRPLTNEDIFLQAELRQYQQYQSVLRKYDVIHDFSHQHFASRFNPNLPSLNMVWHAPLVAKFPKSPYNIVMPSEWGRREFERVYNQKAKFQETITIDGRVYKPKPNVKRTDWFITLGIMRENKGNLKAVLLAKEAGIKLHVAGAKSDPLYEAEILKHCDDKIRYLGEVSFHQKLTLMKTCKALIYAHSEPEVTSHKVQEFMFCGAPVLCSRIGALPEIVTHGVNGLLYDNDRDFIHGIKYGLDQLIPVEGHFENFRKRFSIEMVVGNYLPLCEQVANGLRWS